MANQIIVSEDRNQITVVEGETRIVEVVTQGPQGAIGPIGPAGPSGSSILNQITSGSVTASVDIGASLFRISSGAQPYLGLTYENSGIMRHQNSSPPYFTIFNNNGGVNMTPGAIGFIEIGGARGGSGGTMIRFSGTYIGDGNSRNARLSIGTAQGTGFGGNQIGIFKLSSGSFTNQPITIIGTGVDSYSTSSIDITSSYASRATTIINGGTGNSIAAFDYNGVPQTVLFPNGNWGINTFVDGGQKLQVSGSTSLNGNTTITGSLTVTDTITAQRLVVQTITSSTSYITGSTIFGSLSTNTHQFTGSVFVSGSVGIGTNSPLSALDINEGSLLIRRAGNDTTPSRIIFQGGNGGNGQIYVDQNMTVFTSTAGISTSAIFGISNIDFGSNKGSAALPLIRGTNNVQAGIFFAEYGGGNPGGVAFSTSNLERARFTPTGNLLLGLTTDDTVNRLQVSGSSRFVGNAVISGSTTITSGLSVGSGATISGQTNISIGSGTSFTLSGAVGGSLTYAYASYFGSAYAAILSGANVGLRGTSTIFLGNNDALYTMVITGDKVALGHASPTSLLHISGSTGGLLEVDSPALSNILFVSASGNVGIGTNTPSDQLTVMGQSTGVIKLHTVSRTNGLQFNWLNTPNVGEIWYYGETRFRLNSTGLNLVLSSGGNVILGTNIDDGINRLQVIGSTFLSGSVTGSDMLIRGSGTTSATNALTVANSSSQNILRVLNNGEFKIGNSANFIWAWTYSSDYNTPDINGTNFALYPAFGTVNIGGGTHNHISGNQNNIITKGRFQPTSGTATFADIRCEPLINQTGGANGITRGLLVNPTLNSAWDYRSIEWSNNASSTSGSWGLYGAGTAPNFLSGSLNIGTTATGSSILNVNGNTTILQNLSVGLASSFGRFSLRGSDNLSTTRTITVQNLSESLIFDLYNNGKTFLSPQGSGNVIVGTTVDDGVNRLQVTGSTLLKGSGNTSGTNALVVQNSDAVSAFIVRNDGNIYADGTNFVITKYINGQTTLSVSNTGHNDAVGIRTTSATGLIAVSSLGVSVNNTRGASIYAAGGNANAPTNISLGLLSNRALITSVASGMAMHASSMLQVDSTTQGFLPPRMTTTQMNAISGAAAGLIVYDSTVNKHYGFDGTTWNQFY